MQANHMLSYPRSNHFSLHTVILPDWTLNKIEGTPILKLEMVKRLKVKKKIFRKIKIRQKIRWKISWKNSSKNMPKKFVKKFRQTIRQKHS